MTTSPSYLVKCGMCPEVVFPNAGAVRRHHEEDHGVVDKENEKHDCKECGEEDLGSQHAVASHMRYHHRYLYGKFSA